MTVSSGASTSALGPVGAIAGAQIGSQLGGAVEKGITHMITSPEEAAPLAHSEEGDDAAPSHRFANMASENHTDADADTRWMTPTDDAMPRSMQGYFSSDRTAYLDAQKAARPTMGARPRRVGTFAQDSKKSDFNARFPEVARIKVL
jgi:hypothetical protein